MHLAYDSLMNSYAQQYPWLSKAIFLSFLLKTSTLIYSNRKAEIREIYTNVCHLLGLKEKVYHCNDNTTLEQIFKDSNNSTILLYNTLLMDNKLSNGMSQQIQSRHIIAVEPLNRVLPPNCFLHDDFSLCFLDDQEDVGSQEFLKHVTTNISQKMPNKVPVNEILKANMQTIEIIKEMQGFFDVYLQLLREQLQLKQLTFANSRWRMLIKGLKTIGLNRSREKYRVLTLADCIVSPWFLATHPITYNNIQFINEQVILMMVTMYGAHRFLKNLQDHFWLTDSKISQWRTRLRPMMELITFFYPCHKFPQNVNIAYEVVPKAAGRLYYRVRGAQKKLMSDKFIEIDTNQQYQLQIDIKTTHKMLVYIGLACFDQNKKFIYTVQICRRKNTEVVLQSWNQKQLTMTVTEETRSNLANWMQYDGQTKQGHGFAYLRSIATYPDGNTERTPGIENIIYEEDAAYDCKPENGAYNHIDIEKGIIHINKKHLPIVKTMQNKFISNKTALINHYEAGTYVIGKVYQDHVKQWTRCSMDFHGVSQQSQNHKFLELTRYVRIIVMSNFDSGYPDFTVQNRDAELFFSSVSFHKV